MEMAHHQQNQILNYSMSVDFSIYKMTVLFVLQWILWIMFSKICLLDYFKQSFQSLMSLLQTNWSTHCMFFVTNIGQIAVTWEALSYFDN